ncbi:MAG: AraC family ligand binding domain-containing protein [Planctomycetia bacterium]|nr:AraC family ligand binding domain-containing protein [Planctomycetia bacterium]
MPELFKNLVRFPQDDIEIMETVGAASSGQREISIASIRCKAGWSEEPQTPDFDEYSHVLEGILIVFAEGKKYEVHPGETILTRKGERIQYSASKEVGVFYLSICLPAFTMEATHREY